MDAPNPDLDQAALRSVIDAVAMIRAQSARLGFAALKAVAEGGTAEAAPIEEARRAVGLGLTLVAGDAPVEGHAPVNLAWVRRVAAAEPHLLDRFKAFDALAQELLDATRRGEVSVALAHRVVVAGADEFYGAATRLMVLLWTDLETQRSESVAAARAAMEAAGKAFADLSRRATHAHLLALNARIEAARANAPAFGVIAVEISALADGISSMAKEVGQTLLEARGRLVAGGSRTAGAPGVAADPQPVAAPWQRRAIAAAQIRSSPP